MKGCMLMADTSNFKNGLIMNRKNALWKIVEFLHVKPGKGPAFVRTKLKNIKTGRVVDETFRACEKIQEVRIEARNYNYLYKDGENYVFMDNETFEQIELTHEHTKDVNEFLIENQNENLSTVKSFSKDKSSLKIFCITFSNFFCANKMSDLSYLEN